MEDLEIIVDALIPDELDQVLDGAEPSKLLGGSWVQTKIPTDEA